ncbi:MAG: hypothetical protein ACU0BB_08855 [Paracoccaceae bacterium]
MVQIPDVPVDIRSALLAQGMQVFPHRSDMEESFRAQAVWFKPESCAKQSVAFPVDINLNLDAFLVMNEVSDWAYRVAHIDRSDSTLSRSSMIFAALRARFYGLLGYQKSKSIRTSVVIAAPDSCKSTLTTDLESVWKVPA